MCRRPRLVWGALDSSSIVMLFDIRGLYRMEGGGRFYGVCLEVEVLLDIVLSLVVDDVLGRTVTRCNLSRDTFSVFHALHLSIRNSSLC
jgi:hypothetical protein